MPIELMSSERVLAFIDTKTKVITFREKKLGTDDYTYIEITINDLLKITKNLMGLALENLPEQFPRRKTADTL